MLHFAEPWSNGRSKLAENYVIRIASDFSEVPFGRYREEGATSGQVFREDILLPALKKHGSVTLDLDDVEGLPSSFLEEVMGGLIRHGYSLQDLKSRLRLVTTQAELKFYVRLAWKRAEEQEKLR